MEILGLKKIESLSKSCFPLKTPTRRTMIKNQAKKCFVITTCQFSCFNSLIKHSNNCMISLHQRHLNLPLEIMQTLCTVVTQVLGCHVQRSLSCHDSNFVDLGVNFIQLTNNISLIHFYKRCESLLWVRQYIISHVMDDW